LKLHACRKLASHFVEEIQQKAGTTARHFHVGHRQLPEVLVWERWGWDHDSGRLSFRINPAQRGVERSSLPYQNRKYTAP
jgi:hypothetical protein